MEKENLVPIVGFRYKVYFSLNHEKPLQMTFRDIKGLSLRVNTLRFSEGGQNEYSSQLPLKPDYSNLILNKPLTSNKKLFNWIKNSLESFEFSRAQINITLLNERGMSIYSWKVEDAYPVRWEVNGLHAEKSELAIETIELAYKKFTTIQL